jgi:hypothetical protein
VKWLICWAKGHVFTYRRGFTSFAADYRQCERCLREWTMHYGPNQTQDWVERFH